MSLKEKTVLIIGAGVIASGYAPVFAAEAKNVVVVSRGKSSDELVNEVKTRCGDRLSGDVIAFHADASSFDEVGDVYDEVAKRYGAIGVVVNGSGGNKPEAVISNLDQFIGMKPDTAVDILASNFLSKRYSIQHFARHLKEKKHSGSVVNITSMSGLHPLSKVMDYSAAYAAVENLTLSAAFLFGKCGIGRVNNVAVGFTIGNQNRRLLLDESGNHTPRGQEIIHGTSQSRFLQPEEIAPHVLYLADDERSHAVNGHTLKIDGGYNLVCLAETAGLG